MLKPKNVIDREDKGEIVEAEGGGTMTKVYCTAIVLAAGSGKRMGTKVHKQYLQLCEKPVLAYSLQAFQQSDLIDEIILVVGKGEEEFCRTEIVEKYGFFKVQKIICGGEQRYHSVWNGLKETKAGRRSRYAAPGLRARAADAWKCCFLSIIAAPRRNWNSGGRKIRGYPKTADVHQRGTA
ncbi:IspD/TarI family cytidylyltransferase, partial [[Ruminococcus] torques]|uniref:IspD/TarI family cytidylyltransferase n=1 Tax=[Ruminococcus] torques TaxID=33039 RepID=UPI00241EAC0A